MSCGHAEIRNVDTSSKNALQISYVVEFQGGGFCIAARDYAPAVIHARPVELRAAGEAYRQTEALPSPLLFESASRWKGMVNPFGGPYLLHAASGGPPVYEVPPGEYRLILKYTVSPCAGSMSEVVCTSESPIFRIEEPISFVQED
jgi:hypothetical protein